MLVEGIRTIAAIVSYYEAHKKLIISIPLHIYYYNELLIIFYCGILFYHIIFFPIFRGKQQTNHLMGRRQDIALSLFWPMPQMAHGL